jgi:hypothetical protein
MSSGTALFFEYFYGFLAWHLCACGNDLSGQGCMFFIHRILMRPGTALISIEFRNLERAHVSIKAVCQTQPANQSAAPKCHSPSPGELRVLRRAVSGGCAGKPTHNLHPAAVALPPLAGARSRVCKRGCIEAVSTNVVRHRPKPWRHGASPRLQRIWQNV